MAVDGQMGGCSPSGVSRRLGPVPIGPLGGSNLANRSKLLIGIGIAVFALGSGLVVVVLKSQTAGARTGRATAVLARSVVMAKQPVSAGTAGDDLVRRGLVEQRDLASGESASADAVSSLNQLSGQTVTVNLIAGQDIRLAD